jgi:hypothetical protein
MKHAKIYAGTCYDVVVVTNYTCREFCSIKNDSLYEYNIHLHDYNTGKCGYEEDWGYNDTNIMLEKDEYHRGDGRYDNTS